MVEDPVLILPVPDPRQDRLFFSRIHDHSSSRNTARSYSSGTKTQARPYLNIN